MDEKLILVEKDGKQISVHPLALENVKQLGWKEVGLTPDPSPAEEIAGEGSKPVKTLESMGPDRAKTPVKAPVLKAPKLGGKAQKKSK